MRYFALDVETANPSVASICQIGIALFENGNISEKYETLINPEDYFDSFNIEIHGISKDSINKSPVFPEIYEIIKKKLEGNIVIHHMPFDKTAINKVCQKYKLPQLDIKWLDSAKIVRKTWSELRERGYSLGNICNILQIDFINHNALEDAIAAGKVVDFAIKKSGVEIDRWLQLSSLQSNISDDINTKDKNINMIGNPNGNMFGETIVFTGTLSITRKEAALIASNAGCNVIDTMNKNCTILVVGQQDIDRLAGKEKSSKQIKAEKLIKDGFPIKIIEEDDFVSMCS